MALTKLLFTLMLFTAQADDFFFPQEDFEEENLEDEVDFPGGDTTQSKLRTIADVVRDPFQIKLFDSIKMKWRDPIDEKEEKKEIESQLDDAWHRTVLLDMDAAMTNPQMHHTMKTIRPGDILYFFSKFVNPTDELLTGEEEVLLNQQIEELRQHEGLLDNENKLYFGYLTRGYPRKILNKLMIDLKELRSTTGERRLAEELILNREKPLLQRRAAEKIANELRIKEEKEAIERANEARLIKEDRNIKKQRLAEKAAQRMKEAENKRNN